MSVISGENTWFNPETVFKVVIKFSELVTNGSTPVSKGLSDFVAYAGSSGMSNYAVVSDFNFDFIDSNCDVNMLGVSQSSTACISIYDIYNRLNPGNSSSPYYGCLLDGVHVEIYISDEVDENYDIGDDRHFVWTKYCDWYTTNFEAELGDGGMMPVRISLQDRLNIIGGMEVTFEDGEQEALAGLTGVAILRAVLNNVKWWNTSLMQYVNLVENTDYVILIEDTDDIFGITKGSLVREVINNVCQTLLARAYIRHDGKIYIESFDHAHTSNTWQITGQNSLVSSLTGNNIYSDVCVKYYKKNQLKSSVIASQEIDDMSSEDTTVDMFVSFSRNVASIDTADVMYNVDPENENPESLMIDSIYYKGWNRGANVRINLKESETPYTIKEASLVMTGMVADGEPKESNHYNINTDTKTVTSMTLYYNANQILDDADANVLAQRIASYMKTEIYRKTISGTWYTMKMCVGDELIITGAGSTFNGTYRITAMSISIGDTYSANLTLTPIE